MPFSGPPGKEGPTGPPGQKGDRGIDGVKGENLCFFKAEHFMVFVG